MDDGLTQYPCPSHAGWQQTFSGQRQAPFSRAQPWHSFCAAQQKHHKRTKHSKWFLTGYSEISKRIYYWGVRFCLLIGFCSLLFSGQTNIWCKKKREEGMEAGREGERDGERQRGESKRERARESLENLLFCWRPEKCFPNFSKLGTEIYKPSCTAHIPQVQSPV